ncbi:MAG: GPW/gp25 family protein [Synergistaceae bacterium]|nr:GPW/gp25 family protein [Synergistaceae bacterium]
METGVSRTLEIGRLPLLAARAHLEQSIHDILTTPIGTRVMRPEYGSDIPRLVDQPMNKAWQLQMFTAVASALDKWEPRIKLGKVSISSVGNGYAEISVKYTIVETGEVVTTVITAARSAA